MQIKNKTVWITGASSGIGEQLAYRCAERGANVIVSARDAVKLEKVQQHCKQLGGSCFIAPIDLADAGALESISDQVISRFETIDVLINNGGVSQRASAIETEPGVARMIMETNYFGALALTRKVIPVMIRNGGGQIAVTSSIAGKFGFKLRSSYAASKHALHGYFEALRLEMADKNIGVTIVCPGFIKTNISKSALSKGGSRYNKMDEGQQGGMSAEKCSEKYIRAIEKDRKEILIGGKELMMVYLKRFFPWLFYKIAFMVKAT